MAKQTYTRIIDDITGEPVEEGTGESIDFSVGGVDYTIDLNEKNSKKFHETLKFYTDHAERVGGRRRTQVTGGKTDKAELAAIRKWWRDQGNEISDRGRIPGAVSEAYHAAKGG